MPISLAPALRELELDNPTVVTLSYLEALRERVQTPLTTSELASRLRRFGWLIPLRVRATWQFAPARLGGAVISDRFIELRAFTMSRPEVRVGVGYESAAFLRGFLDHRPDTEVIVFDEGGPLIRALDGYRRTELSLPEAGYANLLGLRVQTTDGIFAAIASRPESLKAWRELIPNLPQLVAAIDVPTVLALMDGRSASAWARAAYLCFCGDGEEAATAMLKHAPKAKGPFYLGTRHYGGYFDKRCQVVDTIGVTMPKPRRR